MAYLNSFDPNNMAANYLGDVGSSVSQPFSFAVPGGQNFVVVAQTNFGPVLCSYSFSLSGANCVNIGAPALSAWGSAASIILLLLAGGLTLRRRGARRALLGIGVVTVLVLAMPRLGSTVDNMSCMTTCSESFAACAATQCGSGAADNDPQCLESCRQTYDACAAACQER